MELEHMPFPDEDGAHATSTVYIADHVTLSVRSAGNGFFAAVIHSRNGVHTLCLTGQQWGELFTKVLAEVAKDEGLE